MPPAFDLPCDSDGVCMACKKRPPVEESVACQTCATPWHVPCLSNPPETVASVAQWQCPDCSLPASGTTEALTNAVPGLGGAAGDLISSIRSIQADESLTEQDKARRRQELISGRKQKEKADVEKGARENDVLGLLDDTFNCSFCMQLPERPVTTPCGHNFCLKCFQKWLGHGRHTCAKCRAPIPPKMVSQPRINSALVVAIRMAKTVKLMPENKTIVYHHMSNENRPDRAFTTERAKKAGKANACSGQIFVTVPPDHFGPILAEHDPKRSKGVLVGESWEDRMECRQWGIHRPHVAGIAGQSGYGAQSVALSGGYEDDEDHGEWFLYTGSGGRDLSGNKRTNKDQSFDQKFDKLNEALRVSCKKGYPVRVVRSHKEKRSAYAPESGVRYDGIYRIEKCWRKVGVQGFKVCRYLFVRCDNEPAPWTSDENGDLPRPLPDIKELKHATDITERKEGPAWDYMETSGWCWTKPPPDSRQILASQESRKILACPEGIEILASPDAEEKNGIRKRRIISSNVKERLLKEFKCGICRKVMSFPVTTPCAHHFCKKCLLDAYDDQSFMRERTRGGRTLRAQKIVKKCPSCTIDISDFLQNPQVNREVMDLIDSLQQKMKQEIGKGVEDENDEKENAVEDSDGNGNAGNEGETDMDDTKVKHVENGMAAEEFRSSDGVIDSMNDSKFSDNGDLAVEDKSVARKECEWFQEEKIESVDGDSDANPRSSETKKSTNEQSHRLVRKRNQPTVKNKADKKAKGGDFNGAGRNDSQLD